MRRAELERGRALRVLLALGLVELVACGSVTMSPLLEADAGAGGTSGAAGDPGNKPDASPATGAAGAAMDARADLGTSPDVASERPPASLPACPTFHVSQDCHSGSSAGGQSFGYCYVCKTSAGSPVTGCTNGSGASGNLCVPDCGSCN